MRQSVWKGPYSLEGGVTQSLLSRWMVCRHRFWLYAVCGAVEDQGLNLPIVYGDAFHNAIEAYALGRLSPEKAGDRIKDYFHKLSQQNRRWEEKCAMWSRIGYDQFRAYCKHWEREDKTLESVLEEQTFKIPYTLPSGRVVYLRGKWDGVIRSGNGRYRSTLDFEHKVKGEIDTKNLPTTLAQNFQVMVYLIPLYLEAEKLGIPAPDGVLYNVIQRPLSGGRNSIVQKKGRKVKNKESGLFEIKGAETNEMFYQRLNKLFHDKSHEFFHRWTVSISREEVDRFRKESLDPLLEQMCDWWDSIQADPFNPWETQTKQLKGNGDTGPYLVYENVPNRLHYRRPFGIYDKMAKGLVGDYQDYLTTGDKTGLKQINTVFPELDAV